MTARDTVALDPQPYQHVAAETFDEPRSLDCLAANDRRIDLDRPTGQALQNLFDEPQALLDLANAYPNPGIDIAGLEHRHLEIELIVWRVA